MREGERIARTYLSKLGWAHEYRRQLNRDIQPAANREEHEAKERRIDVMEEEAEAFLSTEYDKLRKDDSPAAKETLATILQILGHRTDLGFIGKRIVERIRRQF